MESQHKPTSRMVAERAGVSQSTVSIVLNGRMDLKIPQETRERVLATAREMGYSLPNTKRFIRYIGVMVPSLANPFYPQLINDIEQAAADKDLRVISMNSRRNERGEIENLEYMAKQKLIGVIFAYTPFAQSALASFSERTPVVLMGEEVESLALDTVSFNSFRSGEIMARHLIELGHKHIAFLSPPINQTSHSRRKRLMGIESAIKAAPYGCELEILIDDAETEVQDGNYEMNVGFRLAEEALKNRSITALICVNDITAAGAIRAAWSAGRRIPDDIAIAGFDNLLYSSMLTPPLTSIEHHAPQRARLAIDLLLQRAGGKIDKMPLSVEYHPTLIERASTVRGL